MIIWLVVGTGLLLHYYFLLTGVATSTPESASYLDTARVLQEGGEISPFSPLVLRTIFYPYLLSWTSLSPFSGYYDVIKLHLVVHLMTFILVARIFKPHVPLGVIAAVFLFVISALHAFANTILSEWIAAHLFLLLLAIGWKYLRDGRATNFLLLATVGAMLILTRPEFVAVLFIFPILGLLQPRERQNHLVLSTLAAIFCWLLSITPNVVRYEQAMIAPFLGRSFAGVAFLIDPFAQSDFDVAAAVNRHYEATRVLEDDEARYNYFVLDIESDVQNLAGIDYFKFDEKMLKFSLLTISHHPRKFLRHILSQIFRQLEAVPIWLNVMFITAIICLFVPMGQSSHSFIAAMIILHEIYLLFCSATNVMFYRIAVVSLVPILAIVALALAVAMGLKSRRHQFD